ncbi:polysaccharide lyase [Candidatus Sumerlaeota bacterium]|nr:polysaccharide lyase [Candidatus Sumerlaeota bacterium]
MKKTIGHLAVVVLAVAWLVGGYAQTLMAQDKVAGEAKAPAAAKSATKAKAPPAEPTALGIMTPPLPPRLPEGLPPAFPGAWGGGMFTTGGRGGKVIEVTNLDDSGPGSLRAAIETEGPRIVVFRVAGIIYLESRLDINNPDITIAGQSAPGDGICIAHDSLNINTHNVILRHLRVRRGRPEGGQGSDNIGGNPEGQIVVDHCSASWGMDENLSLYRYMRPNPDGSETKFATQNVTVQYCISSEALNAKNHAFGGTWGGHDSTFHHNLFACNTGRNPSIGMGGEFDYRNNVIFNWSHRTMDGGDETSLMNVINCYYKPGPATNENMLSTIARIEQRDMYSPGRRWKPGDWYADMGKRPGKWYVAGNIVEGSPEVTADNWKGMRSEGRGEANELARVFTPFEAWPMNQQTAEEAFETVLAKAGATLPKRDTVDARVTKMVRTGKVKTENGIVSDPKEVGGYPEYSFKPKDVPADADHDGMPDAWEKEYDLNPKDAADGSLDSDGDGYTNVEEFLNGTNPLEKIDYTNLGNNVDSIS